MSSLATATKEVNRLSLVVDFLNKIALGDGYATLNGISRPTLDTLASSFLQGMNVYENLSAGLAESGEVGFFSILSDVTGESVVLYQKVNGQAVEKRRFPSTEVVQMLLDAAQEIEANTATAQTARDQAVAASEASGDVQFFDTKAAADAATLAEGDVVEVFADESRDGGVARYRYESGSLVFKWEPGQRYVQADGTTDRRSQQAWAAQILRPDTSLVTASEGDERSLSAWAQATAQAEEDIEHLQGVSAHAYKSVGEAAADSSLSDGPLVSVVDESGNVITYRQFPTGTYDDTPTTQQFANSQGAIRSAIYSGIGTAGLKAARLGHRAGDLTYQIFTPTYARLLTKIDKYKPRTIDDLAYRVKYVSMKTGNDSDGGSTWQTATRTITQAITSSAADIIYIEAGVYYEPTSSTAFWSGTTNLALIAVGGPVYIVNSNFNDGSWSRDNTSGYEHLWKYSGYSSTSTPAMVIDIESADASASPRFTQVGSKALCRDTPNSYWWDQANKAIYVNRSAKDTVSENEVIIGLANPPYSFQLRSNNTEGETGPARVYCKGLVFVGGSTTVQAQSFNNSPSNRTVFFCEDCLFIGSYSGNSLSVLDVGLAISVRCGCLSPSRDGFNYHAANGLSPHAIEVDCYAQDTGFTGESNNNGSTAHEDVRVFRINGHYQNSSGPILADINTSKAWNVCCIASGGSNSLVLQNTAEAWVDGGVYYGSTNVYEGEHRDMRASDSSTMHVRGFIAQTPIWNDGGLAAIDADMDGY